MQTSFSACANMQAVRTQAHVTDRCLSLSVKRSKCCTAHQRYCSLWLKVMCDIFLMFKHFLVSGLICRDNCKPLIGWFSRSSNKPGELSSSPIHLKRSCSAGACGLEADAFQVCFILLRGLWGNIGHWWNIYSNTVWLLF